MATRRQPLSAGPLVPGALAATLLVAVALTAFSAMAECAGDPLAGSLAG